MLADLPMLREWIATPDVAAWWDCADPFGAGDLADGRTRFRIVAWRGRDFGYMHDYGVHDWPGHHFAHLPLGARGIDQIIGVPALLGQGHGAAFIAQRLAKIFAESAPVIATDPHPDNARAIACYRKVGFAEAGPPLESASGPIQPMTLWRAP